MASGDPADRRAGPRVEVRLDLQLARGVGNAVTARTLDLGLGGARVVSDRPLRIDEELRFELELPPGHAPVHGRMRVVRQHRPDVYGLRFEHIPAERLGDLRAVVGGA